MVVKLYHSQVYGVRRAIVNEIARLLFTHFSAKAKGIGGKYETAEITRILNCCVVMGLAFGSSKFDTHEIMRQARLACYQMYYDNGCKYA